MEVSNDLVSWVVTYLLSTMDVPVGFFFCREKSHLEKTLRNLSGALIFFFPVVPGFWFTWGDGFFPVFNGFSQRCMICV